MLYIVKIDGDNVYVKNTETAQVSIINAYNLILCCENTGMNCLGVSRILEYEAQKYRDAGFKVLRVSRNNQRVDQWGSPIETLINYVLFCPDGDNINDTLDKFTQYQRYLLRCKLAGVTPTIYANNYDEITKTVGTIGFGMIDLSRENSVLNAEYYKYNEQDGTFSLFRTNPMWGMDVDKDGHFLMIEKKECIFSETITNMEKIHIPELTDYVAFQGVKISRPCVLVFPNKDLVIHNLDYLTINIVCMIPERLKNKFAGCKSLLQVY